VGNPHTLYHEFIHVDGGRPGKRDLFGYTTLGNPRERASVNISSQKKALRPNYFFGLLMGLVPWDIP